MREAFGQVDQTSQGTLTRHEFRTCLTSRMERLSLQEVQARVVGLGVPFVKILQRRRKYCKALGGGGFRWRKVFGHDFFQGFGGVCCFYPNSFSYRGSYFKLGSEILWVRCGGGCHTQFRWRCRLVCVGVRRCKTGLSHRVSVEVSSGVCRGQGSKIQDRAVVTQGVI